MCTGVTGTDSAICLAEVESRNACRPAVDYGVSGLSQSITTSVRRAVSGIESC